MFLFWTRTVDSWLPMSLVVVVLAGIIRVGTPLVLRLHIFIKKIQLHCPLLTFNPIITSHYRNNHNSLKGNLSHLSHAAMMNDGPDSPPHCIQRAIVVLSAALQYVPRTCSCIITYYWALESSKCWVLLCNYSVSAFHSAAVVLLVSLDGTN